MKRRRFSWVLPIVFCVASIGTMLVGQRAEALQIAEEEGEYELSLTVFGQGEFTMRDAGGSAPLQYGFSVSKARLKSQATWNDVGSLKIQIGGAGGNVVLKDMVATLSIADPVHFRIGRFKTPISAEYNISSADLIMVDRALLRGLIPGRRIGGDVRLMLGDDEQGGVAFTGELGLFNPVNRGIATAQGQLLTARALLELGFGLDIHASYGQVVFDDNTTTSNPAQPGRPEPFNQTADVALQYNQGRVNAHAEALAVFDAAGTDETPLAFYSHFGYRIGAEDAINVEPMVGYDYVSDEPAITQVGGMATRIYRETHRMTVGANLYWLDSHLVSTLNYRLETRGDVGHAAFLQLQASI
jgi:hypothetical protein